MNNKKNKNINVIEDTTKFDCDIFHPSKSADVYACQALNQSLLLEATAGGFIPVLSNYILDKGGVVYGAAYDDHMNVVHRFIDKEDDIKIFNGSKYVESNMNGVKESVKNFLDNDRFVLFTGTPCQIANVISYCNDSNLKKLITVDVICYGVPSQKIFKEFISLIEEKYKGKVTDFKFRDKHKYGWSHTTVITILKNTGETIQITEPDYRKVPYFYMFSRRNCFLKKCYHCPFNKISRISDFTTGNYWGIEKKSLLFDSKKGVSMVLANTEKGKSIFSEISKEFLYEKRSIKDAMDSNAGLYKGCKYPKNRDHLYRYFEKKGFSKMYHKFYDPNVISYLKKYAKKIIHKFTGKK